MRVIEKGAAKPLGKQNYRKFSKRNLKIRQVCSGGSSNFALARHSHLSSGAVGYRLGGSHHHQDLASFVAFVCKNDHEEMFFIDCNLKVACDVVRLTVARTALHDLDKFCSKPLEEKEQLFMDAHRRA